MSLLKFRVRSHVVVWAEALFAAGLGGAAAAACASGAADLAGRTTHETRTALTDSVPRGGMALALRYSQSGNDFTFDTTGSAKLQVSFAHGDVARVWLEPTGSFNKGPSYAVASESWAPVAVTVTELNDYVRLTTEKMSVRVYKQPMRVDFYDASDATPISIEPNDGGMAWQSGASPTLSLHRELGGSEHIFGLGEDNASYLGTLDRRGTVRELWTGQQINTGHVTADIPITFFMSTGSGGGGYGMFFDNSYRTQFDFGVASTDAYSWEAQGGEFLYYFFSGPDFPTILDRFTELTGRPSMPPLWALGYIQSKCTYYTWDEIDAVVQTMRNENIPLDVMVIDYDWPEQLQNFKWNARWNGESPAKLAQYQKEGIKFLISNSGPMIRKESSNYLDGLANHIFASDGKGSTVTCGHYGGDLMDFTAPNMKSWLWPQLRPLYDEGIAGWWLDLTEPEGEPEQTVYQGGSRDEIHNVFSLLNTKAYYEMQKDYAPTTRPFVLTRTGFAGIQKYGAAIWSGDISSDYETFQAQVPEALSTTLSGMPLWTNDSGGFLQGLYKGNLTDHGKLYERWLQFSTFAPLTRAHHVGPSAPYMFGPDVEASTRKYIQLRYRLLPYIYSSVRGTHETGLPLTRALVLAYQDDPAVYAAKDEFLFGADLLVAPVLTEATTNRNVYFPEGTWIDYDFGYEYQGKQTYRVAAAQDRIPVAVRSGAIIPMAPAMLSTGEKPWDPITFDIFPDGTSHFTLYRDDGVTTAFEDSAAYTTTDVSSVEATSGSVDIAIAESNKLFVPSRYAFSIHLRAVPSDVACNGNTLYQKATQADFDGAQEGWYWDGTGRTLFAKFATSSRQDYALHVDATGPIFSRPTPPVLTPDPPPASPPPSGAIKMPYFYPPPSLPGVVQAENFDRGGEGVSYHSPSGKNEGGAYRPTEGIGIEPTTDVGGGYDVGWIEKDEWLEYTVSVPTAGAFTFDARVFPQTSGGAFHVEMDGAPLTPVLNVAGEATPTWETVSAGQIRLEAGEHVLRVVFDQGGLLVNDFQLGAVGSCSDVPPDGRFSCAQQVAWNKCGESWMLGFCDASCGRCAAN